MIDELDEVLRNLMLRELTVKNNEAGVFIIEYRDGFKGAVAILNGWLYEGDGGGFIFDVRSLPNPGREERFKNLTGRDAPVIDYLIRHESVHQFLGNVMSLVDASANSYQSRGFKHLMVSFGCTGGQHRSVYLAEQLARHLRGRNGIEVVVRHLGLERLGK